MTGERGASKWTVAALLAVVIGVVVSLGVAQGWFDSDGDGNDGTETAPEASAPTTTATPTPTTSPTATSTSAPTTATGDHPLCDLHAAFITDIDGHVPVENSDDLRAFIAAQIEFYEGATEVLDPPERDSFASLLAWNEDLEAYYEALDWDPSPGLGVLAENPPPQVSGEAVTAVTQTLEDLCGVVPTVDQPAP